MPVSKNSLANSVCYCYNEKFKDYIGPNYNLILTGNLDIVQNEAPRCNDMEQGIEIKEF